MRRFSDRVAVVTGGASGIGFSTAERLAADGAAVCLIDCDVDGGKAAVDAIIGSGGIAALFPADVSDEASLEQAIVGAAREFDHLDVLVNAAGVIARGSLAETGSDEWRHVINVDLSAAFYAAKTAAPFMAAAGGGAIVNVASVAAHRGGVNVAYVAAKGGLVALTRQLADELAACRIRVNSVSPGFTATPLNIELRKIGADLPWRNRIPWARYGEAAEVAAACVFLVSSDAAYITGTDLIVDGGLSAVVRPESGHVASQT